MYGCMCVCVRGWGDCKPCLCGRVGLMVAGGGGVHACVGVGERQSVCVYICI